jgi:single-stranded DNA-binding protein
MRSYEGNDGTKRKVTGVIVTESTFIPGGKNDDNRQEPPQ